VIDLALQRVAGGGELSREEMRAVIGEIIDGSAAEPVVAALLALLHARGETLDELVGAAQALRERTVPLPEAPAGAIDTCGTGGDGAGTFNISTIAALVVAGAGVPVAKHGNRAATSRCGSAELLEVLGVRLDLAPERMARAVAEVGIGFLFARACHPAMARVAPLRASLPIPTLFNRLGPLTNPMRPRRQLLGVGQADALALLAGALLALGVERAWVVHGEDGLDEISSCADTRVLAVEDGVIRESLLRVGEFVPRAQPADLAGGDAQENAAIARAILAGEPGPGRDVVLLNAGAALVVAGAAGDPAEGVQLAASSLDSGAARDTLARWVAFCEAEAAA
jgi:anthranilate phosphoribosyltransferase